MPLPDAGEEPPDPLEIRLLRPQGQVAKPHHLPARVASFGFGFGSMLSSGSRLEDQGFAERSMHVQTRGSPDQMNRRRPVLLQGRRIETRSLHPLPHGWPLEPPNPRFWTRLHRDRTRRDPLFRLEQTPPRNALKHCVETPMSGVKVMLEPHLQPNPERPPMVANLFHPFRPLLLSRWVEDAFEVDVRQSPRSKAVRASSKGPRKSSPKV